MVPQLAKLVYNWVNYGFHGVEFMFKTWNIYPYSGMVISPPREIYGIAWYPMVRIPSMGWITI